MASQDIFKHPDLNPSRGQFRVVKLDASGPDGLMSCRMLVRALEDSSPYIALSYIWGTDEPVNFIMVDGKSLRIRSNLAQFMRRAHHDLVTMPIFIDALCINQANTDERNQQVKLMGQIYTNAQRVISWLGYGNGQVEAAIPFIKQFLPLSNGVLQNFYKGKEGNIRQAQQGWSTVNILCALRYWTRVWIVQEVLKAKAVTFVYGDQSIRREDLVEFSRALREMSPCPAPLAEQLFRSRMFNYLDASSTERWLGDGSVNQAKLIEVLWEYGLSACGEKRDRVYALLSLAEDGQHFPVDYKISLTALFLQVWQFRPGTGLHLMAFTKHMIEALLDNYKDIDDSQDPTRPRNYTFELHRVSYSLVTIDDESMQRHERLSLKYQLNRDGPLQRSRTRVLPICHDQKSHIEVQVDVDEVKFQAFEEGDEIYNIENSGLLVVARRNAQRELQMVAKLALSVGLAHSNGKAEITARWLPWSSLVAKSKLQHQAFSIESTGSSMFLCFNEVSLRNFISGVSYERHAMQVLNDTRYNAFEADLLSVHWNVLPTGDFSLDEVSLLQDIHKSSSISRPAGSSLSLLRAIQALTRSVVDSTRTEDEDDETPLPWNELLQREDGPNGPTTSQLHKLFY